VSCSAPGPSLRPHSSPCLAPPCRWAAHSRSCRCSRSYVRPGAHGVRPERCFRLLQLTSRPRHLRRSGWNGLNNGQGSKERLKYSHRNFLSGKRRVLLGLPSSRSPLLPLLLLGDADELSQFRVPTTEEKGKRSLSLLPASRSPIAAHFLAALEVAGRGAPHLYVIRILK
jgi:hypothetical protein